MPKQNYNISSLHQGFFMSRQEVIKWVNNLLHLSITKIQQLGTGAIYCQIMHILHPSLVSLERVNWRAQTEHQFLYNFKILKKVFDQLEFQKDLEIEKLAKARFTDNFKFIRWMKIFFEENYNKSQNQYKASEKRGHAKVDFSFIEKRPFSRTKDNNSSQKSVRSSRINSSVSSFKKKSPSTTVTTVTETKPPIKILQPSDPLKKQKRRLHNFQTKLGMMKEIIQSQQYSEKKISLINQIIHLPLYGL